MLHHLTKITEVVRWSYFYLRRSCGLKTIFCKLWFGVLFSNFFRVSCAVWRSRLPWFMFENPRNQFDWSCLSTQCCNFYVAFREISFPNFGCYLVFSFPDAQLLISWTHYCNTLKQLLANSRVLSPAVSISPNNIFEILGNSSRKQWSATCGPSLLHIKADRPFRKNSCKPIFKTKDNRTVFELKTFVSSRTTCLNGWSKRSLDAI